MPRPKQLPPKVDDRHLRLEYMGGRCAVCNLTVESVENRFVTSKSVFEFNHIDPAQKSLIYEKLMRRVPSATQFDELDKCNLLCRNCHGIWTNQGIEATVTASVVLPDGRVVEKRIAHHGLMEIKEGNPHFYFFPDALYDIAS